MRQALVKLFEGLGNTTVVSWLAARTKGNLNRKRPEIVHAKEVQMQNIPASDEIDISLGRAAVLHELWFEPSDFIKDSFTGTVDQQEFYSSSSKSGG